MYEIKKIFPSSLAKYCSLIMSITILILGIVNFLLNLAGIGLQNNIPWDQQLTSLLASIIFFAIFFWLIGYIFALIYNSITAKTRGVMIEFRLIDKSLLQEVPKEEPKKNKNLAFDKE